MTEAWCVILAAGASRRLGQPKGLVTIAGRTLFETTVVATAGHPVVAVIAPELATLAAALGVRSVCNHAPERGMTWSYRLGDALVPDRATVAILPVDVPGLTPAHLAAVLAEHVRAGADVTYPADGERQGHPVILGPRARERARALPDGDRLRRLKTDPALRGAGIALADPAFYDDLDTPEDLARWSARDPGKHPSER